MAIIIPSKNIYEINNQKVVDNEVDNIEVETKNVVQDNHYSETVHNEEITSGFVLDTESTVETNGNYVNQINVNPLNPVVVVYGSFVCVNNLYHVSKDVFIPFRQDTTHVLTSILTGVNNEGIENIKYSCSGKIITGTTNNKMSIDVTLNGTYTAIVNYNTYYIPPLDESGYIVEKEESGTFSIEYEKTCEYIDDEGHESKSTITIPKTDNLSIVAPEEVLIEGEKYLKLSISNLLCGMRTISGNGKSSAVRSTSSNITLHAQIPESTYIEYIPEKVDISIYGNTIGIDLKDETVKIGNGQHVYSFSGNELIQKTNTPNIENKYNGIIRDWKNGKETIRLKCAVADYFGYDDIATTTKQVESSYTLKNFASIGGSLGVEFSYESQSVTITNNGDTNIIVNISISPDEADGNSSPNTRFNYNYYNEKIIAHGNIKKSFSNIGGIKSLGAVYFAEIRNENTQDYYIDSGEASGGQSANVQNTFIIPFDLHSYVQGEFTPEGKSPYDIISQDNSYCYYESERNVIHWENVVLNNFSVEMYFGEVIPTNSTKYTDNITYTYEIESVSLISKKISVTKKGDNNEDLNMTFQIGDKIIPYLMDSSGNDIPVSLYSDRITPKKFLVVGKGITMDGQITQEITAQEVVKT